MLRAAHSVNHMSSLVCLLVCNISCFPIRFRGREYSSDCPSSCSFLTCNFLTFVRNTCGYLRVNIVRKMSEHVTSHLSSSLMSSPRASNRFNQVIEAKRFVGVFLCRKVCGIQKSNS